jgi:MarR family transcriptional regulator for hemolysin
VALTDRDYLQINQALFSLAHAYESRMHREGVRGRLGLKLSDCSVLMVLAQLGPIISRRLAQAMDINTGTISVYVQRLIEMGLVQKVQEKTDRRHWTLTLTPRGRQAARRVVGGAVEYTREFLSVLAPADQEALRRSLLRISSSLGFSWQSGKG